MNNGRYEAELSIRYTEDRWYHALGHFLRLMPREAPAFVATVISLWGLADVISKAAGNRIPLQTLALPVGVVALGVAIYRTWTRYASYVPSLMASESASTQAILRRKRCGWQLDLAYHMLSERIERSEATLDRVARGVHFVEPTRLSGPAYINWLQGRPIILERLIHAVAATCTSDLPTTVCQLTSEKQLGRMKLAIEAVTSLYECAERFEVESRAIVPPAPMVDLHEMTYGWTNSVRDGIRQLTEVLKTLSSYKPAAIRSGGTSPPDFHIKFEEPANLAAFSEKLRRMDVTTFRDS